jgi:hypothetical protein
MLRGLVWVTALMVWGCGPSEEQLVCMDNCARTKDDCVLNARSAQAIQACDDVGGDCDSQCGF